MDRIHSGIISRSASEETLLLRDEAEERDTTNEEGFLSRPTRRAALGVIFLCWLFTYVSFNAIVLWIPQISPPATTNNTSHDMNNIMYVVVGVAGVIAGCLMDALIKKIHILVIGVLIAGTGIYGMTIMRMIEADHTSPFYELYFAISLLIAVAESAINVALPTIGGDQIPNRSVVRFFYAGFYFCQKAGEVLSASMYLYISQSYGREKMLKLGWPLIIFISTSLSIISAIVVSCSKWTRPVGVALDVIINPFRMMKEAFQRRKDRERVEGEHFLSAAKIGNGGSYPDGQVDEIVKFCKLITILCSLLPACFAAKLTNIQLACYTGKTGDLHASYPDNGTTPHINVLIFPLINSAATLLWIPTIYALCICLSRTIYTPTLFNRLVAGNLVMIVEALISLLYINLGYCTVSSLVISYILIGLGKALVYTAGYELTLISAPRSRQGTAIGISYFLDGIICFMYMEVADFSAGMTVLQNLNIRLILGGVAGPTLGMLALIIIHKKVDLGISIP